ncbi:MAG: hypothetical protein GDA52_01980 [Rhodobacteraceae bacterium]|nr:hypothetical protein [Paracoccaceae bacterium]
MIKKTSEEFETSLELPRQWGWGLDDEEHVAGVCRISCGIRNADGAMISAISVSGPAKRQTKDRIEDIILAIRTAGISRRMGYAPDEVQTFSVSG